MELTKEQIIKALDHVYEMNESPELPVKAWDVANILNMVKMQLEIELNLEDDTLSTYVITKETIEDLR